MYAAYHEVEEGAAAAVLLDLLGGSEDEPPVIDDTPRIVLVAGDFRQEVTTTVLWLVDNFENMDIRCVRLQPFEVGGRILVSSEVIIPLPEAEQYRLSVQRKRREVVQTRTVKAKAGRLVPRLLEAGALTIGDRLYFKRTAVPPDATPAWARNSRSTVPSWPLLTGPGRCSGPTRNRRGRVHLTLAACRSGSCGASSSGMARSRAKESTA